MRILINFLAAFTLVIFSSINAASNYSSHRTMVVGTLPMQHELAIKVIPVVRTFITRSGHIAHVKGSNQIVIAARPETFRVLKNVFESLSLSSFDQIELKSELEKQLKHNHASLLQERVVDIKNIDPKVIIPALRSLVSKEGRLAISSDGQKIEITDYPIYADDMAKLILQLDSTEIYSSNSVKGN